MKACVFAGPSLYGIAVPRGVTRFGPAALGSVYRAVEAGYQRIGIVDGLFGNVPSVWHKEILYALCVGAEVAGAASMGALRAAELNSLGMVGIGRIYRLFRSGHWTDDDEVAVTHATEYLEFRPLSEAMCNFRFTLRRLRRIGTIDRPVEMEISARLKARHFSARTREELSRIVAAVTGQAESLRIEQCFANEYVDAKADDARALLAYFADTAAPTPSPRPWGFPATALWRKQFVQDLAEVPPLS